MIELGAKLNEFSLIQILSFVVVGFFATSYGVLVGAGGDL